MLSSELKETIQTAYSQFLQKRKLKSRHGQKLMIANIANTLANIAEEPLKQKQENDPPHVCVIEAGTGTGKTVAYLIAALPIAQALNKKLVISTATVALQEQIINKDLPEVKNNTDLSFTYTMAKGRGRYLCLSKLDRLLLNTESELEFTQSLYEEDTPNINDQAITIYNNMVDAIAAGKWNGDKDEWETELSTDVWAPVTTNHRECTGRRCSNISSCSFFKAREAIDRYDCIVANHDLVLADLALGGGAILPAPEDTIYIFDEGHHLADKALGNFSYHTRVAATSRWLDQCNKTLSNMLGDISGAGRIDHYAEQLPSVLMTAKQQLEQFYPLCQQLMDQLLEQDKGDNFRPFSKENKRVRFESGIPPMPLIELANNIQIDFDRLTSLFSYMVSEVQEAMEDSYCDVPKVDLETWFPVLGNWQSRAEANLSLWKSYANAETEKPRVPLARWVTSVEFSGVVDFEVCSSPILAAETLNHHLWQHCHGAVVTSATLTALGKFDRFIMRSGTSASQFYNVMPSAFDFSRAALRVPEFAVEANAVTEHTDSIVEHLPNLLKEEKGNLVLFSSRKQMEDVYYQLPASVKKDILMQGDHSKQVMLNKHKQAIDAGKSSTLLGLASFAEGVDLPGDYCRHVIIAKLPFAVPDDPIEASLSEWIEEKGGNAFMDITVPDAAIKLVQACGRLIRTENDSGKITILDKRLVTKHYGKLLLNSLPAFQRQLAQ
jgi:ATP-dependent DNA helicase DinG